MSDDLKQRVIDQILALTEAAQIPSNAITVQDLMRGTDTRKGMSESSAGRLLRKLYTAGKLQRVKGPSNAMHYWPIEGE